jgi:oligopeptide/dipeptide ABC transporter ATP-binding protein
VNLKERILEIRDLKLTFYTGKGTGKILDGVDLSLKRGEILGLIGESGSGKTVTSLAILNLLPQPPFNIESGSVRFGTVDLLKLSSRELLKIRGAKIGMIFQEPAAALDPFATIGGQIAGVMSLHGERAGVDRKAVRDRIPELLETVGMPRPSAMVSAYPHELSGGMQQRAMIARVLACNPEIIIADEPTSSLDVTTQKRLMNLFKRLRQKGSISSCLFITHSFGIIAELCDTVAVMYAGRIVESAHVETLFGRAYHPYTKALMRAVPDINRLEATLEAIEGTMPSPLNPPHGCRFHPRCPKKLQKCALERPGLQPVGEDHLVACYLYEE